MGLLPLVLMLIYTELVLGTPVFSSEIGAMFRSNVATTGSILHFGLEMALLVQLMPIALLLAPAAVSREGRGALIVALGLLLFASANLALAALGLLAQGG